MRVVWPVSGGLACLCLGLMAPALVERQLDAGSVRDRVERLRGSLPTQTAAACPAGGLDAGVPVPVPTRSASLTSTLASWQSVGGCGAGASTGAGAGVKWIGRNVTGGLFNVQCQNSYAKLDDGYTYGVSTLVNSNLGDKWNLGVSIPWLYKYWKDPTSLGYDISNQGVGDLSVLVTRRLGAVNATSVTPWLGIPTGGFKADFNGDVLRQDKQMGHGRYTGGLIVDHTIDNDWGPAILGGSLDYRGGENELESYRSPSGSLYAHAAYLIGALAPAAGITVSKFLNKDKNQGREQDSALLTIAASASLEWSTDWFALLIGGSQPFDTKGNREPWVASIGLSLAPF